MDAYMHGLMDAWMNASIGYTWEWMDGWMDLLFIAEWIQIIFSKASTMGDGLFLPAAVCAKHAAETIDPSPPVP